MKSCSAISNLWAVFFSLNIKFRPVLYRNGLIDVIRDGDGFGQLLLGLRSQRGCDVGDQHFRVNFLLNGLGEFSGKSFQMHTMLERLKCLNRRKTGQYCCRRPANLIGANQPIDRRATFVPGAASMRSSNHRAGTAPVQPHSTTPTDRPARFDHSDLRYRADQPADPDPRTARRAQRRSATPRCIGQKIQSICSRPPAESKAEDAASLLKGALATDY